jgi:hypothetical protein
MKKKTTTTKLSKVEKLQGALTAIMASCDTFMVSDTCPANIRPWFVHIRTLAEVKDDGND